MNGRGFGRLERIKAHYRAHSVSCKCCFESPEKTGSCILMCFLSLELTFGFQAVKFPCPRSYRKPNTLRAIKLERNLWWIRESSENKSSYYHSCYTHFLGRIWWSNTTDCRLIKYLKFTFGINSSSQFPFLEVSQVAEWSMCADIALDYAISSFPCVLW